MITADKLLGHLPPYRDQWQLIKKDQEVNDIINQVLQSHEQYASYYDKIALYFNAGSVAKICEKLYQFCKSEIVYREETEDYQTTALPTGILVRREGDCKHYATFCGGVLDAINRLTGKKIKWWYRFASYKAFSPVPYHVFIVVLDDDGSEIWIDPVPGSGSMTPVWQLDKKIKSKSMALYNNIGGFDKMRSGYYKNSLGVVDPETAASAFEQAGELQEKVETWIRNLTDKVPDYPVKSKNTFDSLVRSINEIIPLPPSSVTDARRLLEIAKQERVKAVGRGTDRATLTVIMLLDERIVALQNYINTGGDIFALPAPGSGSSGLIKPTTGPLTAGAFSGSSLLLLAGAGLGLYLLTKKKTRSVHGKGRMMQTALIIGGSILLIRAMRTKQEHPPVGPQTIMYDPGQAVTANNIYY